MDCRQCSRSLQEDWKHCPFCGCTSDAEAGDRRNGSGTYGAQVRHQVFEVIVRQALAGARWKDICAGPMQLNNISIEEVEWEISRRFRAFSRDAQDDDFLGLPDVRRRLLLLVDDLENLLKEIPKRAIMVDLGQAAGKIEAIIARIPQEVSCKEAITSLWRLHDNMLQLAFQTETCELDIDLSNLIREMILTGIKVPSYKRFESRNYDSWRS